MSLIQKFYHSFMYKAVHNADEVPDVEAWRKIIFGLPQPADGIDTAYNKLRCRCAYLSWPQRLLVNLASAAMLLTALPRLLKKGDPLPPVENNDLLLVRDRRIGYADVIPQQLYTRFDRVVETDQPSAPLGFLCAQARVLFLSCIRRHPFSFWFHTLVLKTLSAYSKLLLEQNTKAVACYVMESNVAFPVITDLCEQTGRSCICFMHGEYLLQIVQAYMRFSEYYVWDPMYVEMFRDDLNCQIGEYQVYTPGKLQKKWTLEQEEPSYFCTYYFSGEPDSVIRKVSEIFSRLEARGLRCKVRPHPRYVLNVRQIFDSFQQIKIELPAETSLRDSLAQTQYAVGLASTVLSEAYIEGRQIVVDDLSDPSQYESLRRRKSSAIRKPHLLLSELYRQAMDGQI